jgi:hypothetical protein
MKNKNRLIRKSVFETNSSSSHSLAIVGDIVYDTLEVGKDGSITIDVSGYDFGRQIPRVTNNTVEKIAFLVTLWNYFVSIDFVSKIELLIDVIKENSNCKEVYFKGVGESEIDFGGDFKLPAKKEEIYDFVFNKNCYLRLMGDCFDFPTDEEEYAYDNPPVVTE